MSKWSLPSAVALILLVGGCTDDSGNQTTDASLRCAASETLCGSSCVDTDVDPRHCGGCGTTCPTGQVCSAGGCETVCPAGQTECGGGCFTLSSSPQHCGACGTSCEANEVCSANRCVTVCPDGQTECSGGCFDLNTAREHCGACGTSCGAGELCSNRSCDVSCAGGFEECDGVCRDTDTDRAHCGGCNLACAAGEVCVGGECEVSCGGTLVECNGVCANTDTDRDHCGGCDTACGPSEICNGGDCELLCATGLIDCGGVCRDTQVDRNNCGGCNTACGAEERCVNGNCLIACAGFASAECGGVCTSTATDPLNCGACNNPCATGFACDDGACAPVAACERDLCGSLCTSLQSDPTNCGTCGTTCPAVASATPVCAAGACAAVCLTGYADCDRDLASSGGNGCEVNTNTDLLHCGACGNACPVPANATAACVGGACGLGQCAPGFENCDGDVATGCEAELATDDLHCGACNNPCASGQVCQGSTCVVAAPGGESCADPIELVPGPNTINWVASVNDYLTATPSCVAVGTPDGPDVVLSYVPTVSGFAEIEIAKPASQRWAAVISDAACGTVTPQLACISDFSATSMAGTISVTAGTPYWIYVVDTTSGTAPLSNPLSVTVTETDCSLTTAAPVTVNPGHTTTASSLAPTLSFSTDRAMNRTVGTINITGSLGTNVILTIPTAQVVFAADNRSATINPGVTFMPGEQVTVSWTGLVDGLCSNPVQQPEWSFTIPVPPCAPGTGGMVGTTQTRFPTGLATFTETQVTADADPNGFVYVGGTTVLHRMSKAGGPTTPIHTQAGLTSTHLGYGMVINGPNIYTLRSSSATSQVLWRISTDNGATWQLQDMAVFPAAPQDLLRAAAFHDGRIYMMTNEFSFTVDTQIWSVDANAATLPDTAVLDLSFGANAYMACGGLAVDNQYYYTTCRIGSAGTNFATLRVHRTTGAITQIGTHVGSASAGYVHVRDTNADGLADFVYVQNADRRAHFICGASGATPYADMLTTWGASSTGNFGMGYDPTANVLWAWDDSTREFVRIQ